MRQIKFRAWNDVDKKMCDNGVVTHRLSALLASKNYHVMQFTGLTDINGVEIYEGDIVRLSFDDGVTDMFKVVYKAPAFRLEGFGIWSLASQSASTEVIGNIYQNPELLK